MKTCKNRRRVGLVFFLLICLSVSYLFYDSNTSLVTDAYSLYFENLPPSFDGYRIVQLSDIHAAVLGQNNATLLAAVQKARPNIIVITGDLIDSKNDLPIVSPLVQALTGIAPVYFVTGNHEWRSGALNSLLSVLTARGVTVFRNSFVRLTVGEESIVLAGVDDPNGPADMKTPEALMSEIHAQVGDPFVILLAHRNDALARYASLGIDLVLSGHAHGGLVRLPLTDGLIGPSREWFPKYTSGVYTDGATQMLVSRGIGNRTGYPRLLNNPELVVAILRRTK
ncbi:metallophosphoesterase [Oscillospiraceae bacterium CM]|nr:metallophosphoesterase [Oscillospiraceae bacterium CM]